MCNRQHCDATYCRRGAPIVEEFICPISSISVISVIINSVFRYTALFPIRRQNSTGAENLQLAEISKFEDKYIVSRLLCHNWNKLKAVNLSLSIPCRVVSSPTGHIWRCERRFQVQLQYYVGVEWTITWECLQLQHCCCWTDCSGHLRNGDDYNTIVDLIVRDISTKLSV